MKLINVLLEQQDTSTIIRELDSYAAEFEDKLYTYSDEELVRVKGQLEDLLVSKATDSETLLQNIADFIDDILGVGDIMPYPFDVLEKLPDLELFDFYNQVEDIVRRLIEHIEGNVMYDRSHQASGVDEIMKPKKLSDLELGEKFFFNDDHYQFIKLGEEPNTAKVKLPSGKTSIVSFGGGVVNKKFKPGLGTYLAGGGREWD